MKHDAYKINRGPNSDLKFLMIPEIPIFKRVYREEAS